MYILCNNEYKQKFHEIIPIVIEMSAIFSHSVIREAPQSSTR